MPRPKSQFRERSKATSTCSACGADVMALQNFCGRCGTPLRGTRDEVPEYLQEHVRSAQPALQAEHKFVTILFADIVGSTKLISDLEPEEASAILDPVLQEMVRAVHKRGGVIAQFQGDAIMALFGAPLAQEDHAINACRAALDIRMLATDPRVQTRIGLNSGEIALRVIRNAGFVEYDAVGVSVHIAARMEQAAQPKSITITDTTKRLLGAKFALRSLGSLPVKGAPDGNLPAFEVIGEVSDRRRGSANTGYDRGPFINRTAEMATLREAAAAAAGRGQVVAISGHAGLGKSRLVHELAASLEEAGWLTLETSVAGEEKGPSYGPFVRVLCDCLGTELDGQHTPVAQQLETSLAKARPQFVELLAPLLALLGAEIEEPSWNVLSPAVRRRRILEAFATVVRHTAARQKLLLVAENVHWLDRESESLLEYLIKELSNQSVLVVATYRPGYKERWKRSTSYRGIKVKPLSQTDCSRLLDAKLGVDPSLSEVKAQLVARTQGVPLFVEEMVKSLSETAVLHGESGNFRTGAEVIKLKIPDGVRPVLAARIDRLPAEPKEILQVAAAIGSEFRLPLLAAARSCSVAQLVPHLEVLEAGDFIVARKGKVGDRFAFRHVLVQEVTYRSLLSTKRQRIHAAIAVAIEKLYPQRLKEESEVLARHCLEGQLWDRAVTHLRVAARKAIDHAAHPEAIRSVEQALDVLNKIPERGRQNIESEIELRLLLRESLGALGRYDQWLANMDVAERLATELGDDVRILAIRVARLHLHNVRTDIRRAIIVCQDAQDMARAQGDSQRIVAAAYFQSQAQNWHGEFRAAIACLQNLQPILDSLPPDARCGMTGTATVMCHAQLAPSHAWLGEFSKALVHARTAWRLADQTKREFDRAVACFGYGTTLVLQGAFDRAAEILERGLAATERAEIPLLFEALAGPLSYAHLNNGNTGSALLLSEQLLARPEVSFYSRSWALFYRAYSCMATGQTDVAASFMHEARLRAHKNGYQGLEAAAHLALCRFWRMDDEPLAKQHLATASAMAARLHLAPLEAHCFAETARFIATERPGNADAAALAANRRYRKLGMRFELTPKFSGGAVAHAPGRNQAVGIKLRRQISKGEHRVDGSGTCQP
jgi:class 3 adenylate cyclase/tetratricopeptide (TPR) repeat protein